MKKLTLPQLLGTLALGVLLGSIIGSGNYLVADPLGSRLIPVFTDTNGTAIVGVPVITFPTNQEVRARFSPTNATGVVRKMDLDTAIAGVGSSTNVGVAHSIKTTGASVVVSNSAPPTVGQTLVATSATSATWQTVTGGGTNGGATASFTSSLQTITSAGALTLPHGLGVIPTFTHIELVNQVAELGYVPGDILFIESHDGGQSNQGVSIVPDTTNLNVRFSSVGGVFNILNKTTGVGADIVNTSWLIRFRAWGPIGGALTGGVTSYFTSTNLAITSAGTVTLAHGLGVTPVLTEVRLINQIADQGYSPGDQVIAPQTGEDTANYGIAVVLDATSIFLRYGTSQVFYLIHKNTGVPSAIAPANWKARVSAWGTLGGALTGGVTSNFTSTNLTITSAGTVTLAHGLGAAPELIQLRLKNITPEIGYSVNDEAVIDQASYDINLGATVIPDATNVVVRYGSHANVFSILNKTTGGSSGITPGSWRLIVRAWGTLGGGGTTTTGLHTNFTLLSSTNRVYINNIASNGSYNVIINSTNGTSAIDFFFYFNGDLNLLNYSDPASTGANYAFSGSGGNMAGTFQIWQYPGTFTGFRQHAIAAYQAGRWPAGGTPTAATNIVIRSIIGTHTFATGTVFRVYRTE